MSIFSWTLWVVATGIGLWRLLLALFKYLNKRGGSKRKVVRASAIWTLCFAFPVYILGLFFVVNWGTLMLLVGNTVLKDGDSRNIAFAIEEMDYPSSTHLPLYIKNGTAETLHDIIVSLIYTGEFFYVWPEGAVSDTTFGAISRDWVSRQTSMLDGDYMTTILLDKLNPEQEAYLAEPFAFSRDYQAQLIRFQVPVIDVQIRITAEDLTTQTAYLKVRGIFSKSLDELIQRYSMLATVLTIENKEKVTFVSPEYELKDFGEEKMYFSDGIHDKVADAKQ